MPAEPTERCEHGRTAIVASQALVLSAGGPVRTRIRWCVDCGALRPESSSGEQPWYAPGVHSMLELYDMLKAQSERTEREFARGGERD